VQVSGGNGNDWLDCPRTKAVLTQIDDVLHSVVSAEDVQMRVMASYVLSHGGKRLRPALLLLMGELGEGDRRTLVRAAAALELIHVASLYHDDVMDRAPMRRRRVSPNVKWGNAPATLAGTYLFARASSLLASLGAAANRLASEATVLLAAGQLMEVENAYNLDLEEAVHFEIVRRKTATLFELPLTLGGLLARIPDEMLPALKEYGRKLGITFQLADDALDLMGREAELGKQTAIDIRDGVYTLATLRTLRRADRAGSELRALLGLVAPSIEETSRAVQIIVECGEAEAALATAHSLARAAQQALSPLSDGPVRRSLHRLADFAVDRSS
jgi:heptaprenyl diphosphate synthase